MPTLIQRCPAEAGAAVSAEPGGWQGRRPRLGLCRLGSKQRILIISVLTHSASGDQVSN